MYISFHEYSSWMKHVPTNRNRVFEAHAKGNVLKE